MKKRALLKGARKSDSSRVMPSWKPPISPSACQKLYRDLDIFLTLLSNLKSMSIVGLSLSEAEFYVFVDSTERNVLLSVSEVKGLNKASFISTSFTAIVMVIVAG